MKRVLSYLYPYRLRMLLGFIIKVLGTLSELLLPVVLTHILKNVVVTQDLKKVLLFGSLMLVFSGIACAFNIIANRMAAWVGRSFSEALRRDLFYRTLTLDATETDAFTVPSLESRITTDTYHVHNFVMMIQRMGVRAPILLLGGVVITLLMDAFLALVILAVMPVIFLSIYFVSRLGVSLYRRVQKSNDSLVRVVREDYNGIRVIKALSKEEHEQKRFEKANHQLSKNEQIAGIAMGATHPIMTLLMNCGITAVVAIAALRVANHQSSTETVIAFMQYFTLISMALMTVSRMFVMYSKCAASAARISAVLETPDTLPVCPHTPEEKGDAPYIRFSNVTFAYGESAPCLSHISFSLEKGQSLGIIGATGSGKSTLIKLLLRFYDTKEGEIIFRGRPIKSYTREEISAFCGVSHQKNFLYAASVAENIRFGREIGEEALSLAARTAQAEAFILALAEGYQTPIATGGTNLSGGQRQRLMIARALAGSPELLILDDSSSALDYKTDAALRRAISDNYPDLTTVTVAQRVSSVMQCSLILVLDEGEIVGMGTHETLLRDCSVYREISASQIGGALFE